MNYMRHARRFLLLAVFSALPYYSFATCYKVTSVSATSNSNSVIRPGEGVASSWAGACDTCNGSLGLPSVINVSDGSFIPYPALLASSIVPFTEFGTKAGGYPPEQVLFRCEYRDAVYEMFSTNGDSKYGGYYKDGDAVGNSLGLSSAYDTALPNVMLRLLHIETGEYFTDIWKERLLTNLDTDSRGYKLVKAKNLSAIQVELFSGPNDGYSYYNANTLSQPYNYSQPGGYIAIRGPGLTAPTAGTSHGSHHEGWHANWPGAISLYHQITLKRYPTCAVLTATPYVQLPSISSQDITNGRTVEAPFEITFKCQASVGNGTSNNETALGIKVSAGALSAATTLNLVNSNGGVSHLVSDAYGTKGIAKGVGILILRNGMPINLLSNENSAGGNAQLAQDMGWYPAISSATIKTSSKGGITQYRETFTARLEKLDLGKNVKVTPGLVKATAQVVIRVQ